MKHMFPQEPSHSGYVRGCRCEGCVDCRRIYNKAYMRKKRRDAKYEDAAETVKKIKDRK